MNAFAESAWKFLDAIKDFPLWLLAAIAIAVDVFLLVPQLSVDLPKETRTWFVFGAVLFTFLAIARGISVCFQLWRSRQDSANSRRTLHLTPISHQSYWSANKQMDNSVVTQINAHFMAKNRTHAPLKLVAARVIRPVIRGEVLQDLILVRAPNSRVYGSALVSDYAIPAETTLPVQVTILIRGCLRAAAAETVKFTLGIDDDDGNEQRVPVVLKRMPS